MDFKASTLSLQWFIYNYKCEVNLLLSAQFVNKNFQIKGCSIQGPLIS